LFSSFPSVRFSFHFLKIMAKSFALLPAAGNSVRMGRPKLSLPLGERTILEQVIHTFRQGGVQEVLVVLGPTVAELALLAQKAGAHVLALTEATADMRATVEHGLLWLEQTFAPQPADPWLLCPADHPVLEADVIAQLLRSWKPNQPNQILIPTCDGRRGHPAVIAWRHVQGLRTLPTGLGLNVYLRQHDSETTEIPTGSNSILFDLDTPEDYLRLLERWGDR
jgi:CTP:molybdopterin cytidylyltransferase MocA